MKWAYNSYGSGGLLAPVNAAEALIAALHDGFAAAISDPRFRQRIDATGTTPISEGQASFAAFLGAERTGWQEVARL